VEGAVNQKCVVAMAVGEAEDQAILGTGARIMDPIRRNATQLSKQNVTQCALSNPACHPTFSSIGNVTKGR
jgi:hypothetical protein